MQAELAIIGRKLGFWILVCGLIGLPDSAPAVDLGFGLPDTDTLFRKVRRGLGLATEEEKAGIAYDVRIEGVEDSNIKGILTASSQLVALNSRPVRTRSSLRRRADDDVSRFTAALRSEGFYEAEVGYDIRAETDITAEQTPTVVVSIAPGPQYRLSRYDIQYKQSEGDDAADLALAGPDLDILGITPDMPARAPEIIAVENRIKNWFLENGYPFVKIGKRRAVINRDADTMAVTLHVMPGPALTFGSPQILGLRDVEKSYIQNAVAWTKGEPFDQRKLDDTRRTLTGSGLFTSVFVKPAEEANPDGSVPIEIKLNEADHRRVGAGLSYATDLGFGADAFWQHRNIFGQGEALRFDLKLAEIEQSLSTRYEQPDFFAPTQSLIADAALRNRTTDGFDEQSASGSVSVFRTFGPHWRIGLGVAPEYSAIDDSNGEREFFLLGAPLNISRTDIDDLLSPNRGTRLNFNATPYIGFEDDRSLFFVSMSAAAAAYYALDSENRYVLAARSKVGSVVGEDTAQIPANRRFFAGGGGSIRGFEFQSVGPRDANNEPAGGRSVVEVNAELRIKITDAIGVVPFIDGGGAFDNSVVDFDESFRWAVGIGARYYTPIGPLRVDVATPLRRKSDEDQVLFYIGLGQAF